MGLSPKSLILDLLSTVGRHSMPVCALVAAGGVFGLDENRMRVALARLLGRVIRLLALDPRLPDPIVVTSERRALIGAMRDYDRRGRNAWRSFMHDHDAPFRRPPLNSGPAAAALGSA